MMTIGVDVGSTSVKAVRYDASEQVPLQVASGTLDARIDSGAGHFEEDPEGVAALSEQVIREAARNDVVAICFTGQMHGGLISDSLNRPLTPAITWQDRRSEKIAEALRQEIRAEVWDGVGSPIYAGFLGATVHALGTHVHEWRILGVYEWVASRVLGVEPYTDPGSAAAWGLYDIRDGCWSAPVLAACGIPREALPRVVAGGETVGTVSSECARRLGLPDGVRVVSGTGDTQASFLGSGCRRDELLVNFGTGSQLLWESPTFARWPSTDIRALPGGNFLVTVPTLAGGAAYAVLADFFRDVMQTFGGVDIDRNAMYERMNEIADAPTDVTASALFNGSRFLGEELRGAIGNLDTRNFTAAGLSRAILEAMVDELAVPYLAIPAQARPHVGLVGSGNGMRRNPVLRSIVERRFGMSLRLSPHVEEAAIGAARLAANITSSS